MLFCCTPLLLWMSKKKVSTYFSPSFSDCQDSYSNATRPLKFFPIITIEIYCFCGCYVIVNFDANAGFSSLPHCTVRRVVFLFHLCMLGHGNAGLSNVFLNYYWTPDNYTGLSGASAGS